MIEQSLPEMFIRRMAEQLGEELPAFLACYGEPARRGIRLNTLKPLPAGTAPEGLGDPIPWAGDAYFLAEESRIGAHPLHEAGACYIQEPSAMLPAAVLTPRPGERVLDLCAAPGGKSTQMAAMMRGRGLLVCNEPVHSRAQVLSRNVERMGVVNAVVTCAWPDDLARRWPEAFDAVMVDAPCSGEGMFRRVPESRGEWTPQSPAGCAQRQAGILGAAARMVRPGGRLVYATCTLNDTENRDQVEAFLASHPDFELQPFALPGATGPEGMLTCYPHRMPGEGQFCALMRRKGDAPGRMPPDGHPRVPDRTQRHALAEAFPEAPVPDGLFGDSLILLPELPDLAGLQVLRCGLHLGSVRNGRFLPDHAWAVSSLPPVCPRVTVTEEEARRYQAGETLRIAEETAGWVLPVLSGLPLGWGKATGGVLKNHYPKGLRRPYP
ncbi:MAG: RsmF rRNA methyltransferase first C-terminal domain-containing protein [Clostridia bacterium]|nr:RsmF rRNA methyltransferase first C-terminal domain-containing protein [Clostridia bacterium]